MVNDDPAFAKLLEEINQAPKVRQRLIKKIERSKKFKSFRVVLYATSFRYPAAISDDDANIIEGVLQKTNKSKELLLIINSPGGNALAAERIINVCRAYSENGYAVLIPKMAKSAATLIALGSKKIYMGSTSELGSVDPQITVGDKRLSAYSIVESYRSVLEDAVKAKGHIDPYIQLLSNYDPREIKELELIQDLSVDIATNCLQTGMMKGKNKKEIKEKIKIFLTPESTKVHGRAIYPDVAKKTGLKIEVVLSKEPIWSIVWDLFIRTDHIVNTKLMKLVETSGQHFSVRASK